MKRTGDWQRKDYMRRTEFRRDGGVAIREGVAAKPSRRIRTATPQQHRRQQANAEYKRLRAAFLAVFTVCARCGGVATECHHAKGRGPYYLRPETYVAMCHDCHAWATQNPDAAIEAGLSEKRLSA